MAITIDIPPEVEESLRAGLSDLDNSIKETALVGLYRQRKLSHHQMGLALGLSWHEVEALLKRHNMIEDGPSAQEIHDQVRKLASAASCSLSN
jgi:hypothetical protein